MPAKITMRKEPDYTYELLSSQCGSSHPHVKSTVDVITNSVALLWEERIDLHFGLLDKLLACGALTGAQYNDVKACQSTLTGYEKLDSYIFRNDSWDSLYSALQDTKQQHLLNYQSKASWYDPKFGGDWPLTDLQMMILNMNQEVLVELIEMSPALIERLYSRNVLNKRHKDFICGQLSEIKKSETFLDILRRRSFREYKETVKSLRASNQQHIADVLEGGVVGRILCSARKRKSSERTRFTMKRIVEKYSKELARKSLDGKDLNLQLIQIGLIDVRYDNGIVLYLHIKNFKDLQPLDDKYKSGEMKTRVECDFNKLLHTRNITVRLECSGNDYERCRTYLRRRPLNHATCIHGCPMEVREIILSKAYALFFYLVRPHPKEKELFTLLSSVCRNWRETISRRFFKSSINRYMSYYFSLVSKRNTVIRKNRQYLVEKIKPCSILIRRLEKVGCLTRTQVHKVERLRHYTAKNDELLNVARRLNFKKHFAFIESLHFCGQLKVANVIEKGGVVIKAEVTHKKVPDEEIFGKLLKENISQIQIDFPQEINKLFSVNPEKARYWEKIQDHILKYKILQELEILEIKHFQKRKGNKSIVVWLWCKTQNSLRRLCELKASGELLNRLDFLIDCLRSSREEFSSKFPYRREILPHFLKTITVDAIQFQKLFVTREISIVNSGSFLIQEYKPPTSNREISKWFHLPQNTPPMIMKVIAEPFHLQTETPPLFRAFEWSPMEPRQITLALASLDDKIYLLSEHLVCIYPNIAPFTCHSKVAFPSDTFPTRNIHTNPLQHFMETCHRTKCIYIFVNSGYDSSVWKLTTLHCDLKMWMSVIGQLNSLSVSSNGNVSLLKVGQGMQSDICYLEIYDKDAAIMHRLQLPCLGAGYRENMPVTIIGLCYRFAEPRWAVEISPGNLVIDYGDRLIIRSVNFATSTTGPVLFEFPKETFLPMTTPYERITSYATNRMIFKLCNHLAIFDQRLNMDVIPYCLVNAEKNMIYNKDNRQLILWSLGSNIVCTYRLACKGEDIFADDDLN